MDGRSGRDGDWEGGGGRGGDVIGVTLLQRNKHVLMMGVLAFPNTAAANQRTMFSLLYYHAKASVKIQRNEKGMILNLLHTARPGNGLSIDGTRLLWLTNSVKTLFL